MNGLKYEVKSAKADGEHVELNMLVLFVLEGSMTVYSQGDRIPMKEGDILLISPGVSFSLHDVRDTLCGEAVYPSKALSEIMRGQGFYLYANPARDVMHSYQELRDVLYDLTAEYTAHSHMTTAAADSLLLKLLDLLIENYQIKDRGIRLDETESDTRMRQIMQYIVNHITDEISLSDLADSMFVSTSTLSRIFRKSTGMYFSDYITKLRVQSAIGLLEHSDQNLTQIAMSCGFSNSSAFNRSFKKQTGMNPSEYRESKKEETKRLLEEKKKEEEAIREKLTEKGYQNGRRENEQQMLIDFDDKNKSSYTKVWQKIINFGDLYLLTHANIQQHALYLREQLHFEYIRVWNVFSINLQVSDGKTPGMYNFDGIDQALDFLVQHHMKPYLDLSRRPSTALRSQGSEVYFREEYIDFKSREIWEQMIYAFFSHILNRYGQEEVAGWIFELTRDPDHRATDVNLYADPSYDFFDAWKYVCQTVHTKVPGALFGGISATMISEENRLYLQSLFLRAQKEDCVPDFISFILFPYQPENDPDMDKTQFPRHIAEGTRIEAWQVSEMHSLLDSCGLFNTKLFISEWNNTISNRNYLNDGCFRAAYLVAKTEELWGETDLMGIMAGSDWISSYIDTQGLINGSIGLVSKEMICKPAFYAIEFLNQLGKNFISRGDHYIATVQDNGDVYILFFHFSWYRHNSIRQDENIDLDRYRNLTYEDERPLNLHVTLEHLKRTGNFYVKRRTLNRDSGSILDEWGRFQYSSNLTRQDIKYLRAICTPRISISQKGVGKDHKMELDLTLEAEEISLVHIYPIPS